MVEPYGAVRAEFGEVDGSWGWATHRKAESHGLTFMRARWYSAGVGRFVQADTVVPDPTSAGAFNRHAYVGDNPIGGTDPSHFGLGLPTVTPASQPAAPAFFWKNNPDILYAQA